MHGMSILPTKFIRKNSGGADLTHGPYSWLVPALWEWRRTPPCHLALIFFIKKWYFFLKSLNWHMVSEMLSHRKESLLGLQFRGNHYIPSDADTTASERLLHPETSSSNICFRAAPSSGQKKHIPSIARGGTRPQRTWKIKQMRNYMFFSAGRWNLCLPCSGDSG